MFLIRTGFWLGLVVLLLPTDEGQQQKLKGTASTTVERMSTFCERNTGTCQAASRAWQGFTEKAQFGARLAMDLAMSRGEGERRAMVPPTTVPVATPRATATHESRGADPARKQSRS